MIEEYTVERVRGCEVHVVQHSELGRVEIRWARCGSELKLAAPMPEVTTKTGKSTRVYKRTFMRSKLTKPPISTLTSMLSVSEAIAALKAATNHAELVSVLDPISTITRSKWLSERCSDEENARIYEEGENERRRKLRVVETAFGRMEIHPLDMPGVPCCDVVLSNPTSYVTGRLSADEMVCEAENAESRESFLRAIRPVLVGHLTNRSPHDGQVAEVDADLFDTMTEEMRKKRIRENRSKGAQLGWKKRRERAAKERGKE